MKMCEWNKWGDTRIDPCMRKLVGNLSWFLSDVFSDNHWKIVACCCGHGKYPMTIICESPKGRIVEIVSDKVINRAKKFYKRDRQGYYFIPEVLK